MSDDNILCDLKLVFFIAKEYGAVVQLGARNAGSVEVEGSNPSGSILYLYDR